MANETNEELLRELINAAYNSGYDAAIDEEFSKGILLRGEAKLNYQQELSEVIERREVLRAKVLICMGQAA